MDKKPRNAILCSLDLWQPHERTAKCATADRLEDADTLHWLAMNDYGEAGFHAGANPNLSQSGRQEVAQGWASRGRGGRLGLILNPSATQEDFDLLAYSNDNTTRDAAANYASSEMSLNPLLALASESDTAVILASVPNLPQRVYGAVMGHRKAIPALVRNPSCPEVLLESILEGRDPGLAHILAQAVRNPKAPIGSILSLPEGLGVSDEILEGVVHDRKEEAGAWMLAEYGAEIDFGEVPLEWVREMLKA